MRCARRRLLAGVVFAIGHDDTGDVTESRAELRPVAVVTSEHPTPVHRRWRGSSLPATSSCPAVWSRPSRDGTFGGVDDEGAASADAIARSTCSPSRCATVLGRGTRAPIRRPRARSCSSRKRRHVARRHADRGGRRTPDEGAAMRASGSLPASTTRSSRASPW